MIGGGIGVRVPPRTPPGAPLPAGWRSAWRPVRLPAMARAIGQARNLPLGLAVAALLLAAGLGLIATPRWRAEQAMAEQAAGRQSHAPRAVAPAAATAPGDDQRLLAALPPSDAATQRVADLLALAEQHGLVVQSTRQALPDAPAVATPALPAEPAPPPTPPPTATARHTPAAAPATGLALSVLRLSMGVQGGYVGLRRFVAEALQHDDALLLDQLRLLRPSPQDRALTADLQWLLLQRDAPPVHADGSGPATAAAPPPGRQR